LVELRHQVTVSVERGLDRGVTQLRLDVLRVGAVGDQQAGIRVAEVVKPDAAEPGPPECRRELPVPEVVSMARATTEDNRRRVVDSLQVAPAWVACRSRQRLDWRCVPCR
jgi:hypothetical protein